MPAVSTNARDIFLSALDQANPTKRAAFISQACAGDVALQRHVEALLKAHDEPDSLLDQPRISLRASDNKVDHSPATIDHSPTEAIGTLIGPYKLLEQIGEGGMGLVYMAEQQRPMRRLVALKIIKPGMDTKQVIARFEAEKQALAMMDHQNIARVFDAGTTDTGRPYFAMELVRGIPINEFCDQKRLAVRERLELVVQVCEAIQHAHQKGIIHRDLKPTNVLVTLADTIPVPKVIDFGIAKALGAQLTEHTLHTGFAQLIGTPLYMSPEQAELNQFGVDTRSDVYSLGVMLYELLTGTTPFDKETLTKVGFDEMRRIIREVEPETVSARIARTKSRVGSAHHLSAPTPHSALRTPHLSELDCIVSKSLEKDRSLRYESASALAADIQRYLSDEPVLACPPAAAYRLRKFARKHKAALTTAALVALALIVGTVVSTWQAMRATHAESLAKTNESLAKNNAARAVAEEQKAREQERNVRTALADVRLQREKARRAVDEMYTQVAEKWLSDQPNLTTIQRAFLEKALVYYEEFAAEAPDDPQVKLEAVRSHHRAGVIRKQLGQYSAAEHAFRSALEVSDELLAGNPNWPDCRIELGYARAQLAELYWNTGRRRDSRREAELANDELSKIQTLPQESRESRKRLAMALDNVASRLRVFDRDHAPAADRAAQVTIAAWKSLVADYPQDFDYRVGLACAYETRATNLMWWGGKDEGVESAFLEADTELSKLLQEQPTNVRCRRALVKVLGNLGVIYGWRDSRNAKKVEVQRRVLPLCESLAKEFPDVLDFQASLVLALHNLAHGLTNLNQAQDAEEYIRRALQICEGLVDRNPDSSEFRVRYLESAKQWISWLQGSQRLDEARAFADRMNGQTKSFINSNPAMATDIAGEIDKFYFVWASVFVKIGDHVLWAHALDDLPTSQTQFSPEMSPSLPGVKCCHVLWLNDCKGQLQQCASLAEQDATLSPTQRAKLVQRYQARAQSFHQHADRAAEDYIQAAMSSPEATSELAEALLFMARSDLDSHVRKPYLQEAGRRLLSGRAEHTVVYQMADLFSTVSEEDRDPELGLKLARRAVELRPADRMCWQSLGWALYRSGDFRGCLEKLKEHTTYSESESGFVVAMANWRLGNQDAACTAFTRADEWLKGYEQRFAKRLQQGTPTHPRPTMLKRLRAEAESLLGLTPADRPASSPTPDP